MQRINAATGKIDTRLKIDLLAEALTNKDDYPVRRRHNHLQYLRPPIVL